MNFFVEFYRTFHEIKIAEQQIAAENGVEMPQITMAIKYDCNQDPRNYNNSHDSEVAVVFENDDG